MDYGLITMDYGLITMDYGLITMDYSVCLAKHCFGCFGVSVMRRASSSPLSA